MKPGKSPFCFDTLYRFVWLAAPMDLAVTATQNDSPISYYKEGEPVYANQPTETAARQRGDRVAA